MLSYYLQFIYNLDKHYAMIKWENKEEEETVHLCVGVCMAIARNKMYISNEFNCELDGIRHLCYIKSNLFTYLQTVCRYRISVRVALPSESQSV